METLGLFMAGVAAGAIITGAAVWYANRTARRERTACERELTRTRAENGRLLDELHAAESARRWHELRQARDDGYHEGRLSPANDAERFAHTFERFGAARFVVKDQGGRVS